MGEVYRARDTKLDRDVALKILPDSFASDPDRLMRFEREAKTLASLNHPNIAAIYGIEDRALVMELVEGEDLSTRIARGPISLDDALPIAKQIAEALEAAHEQGIIHRDLKPANIKLRPDGTVKVLDFGLAKALERLEGEGFSRRQAEAEASALQTITSPAMTVHGMILGTAAYMSPEQAKGKTVDRRADIWAFGVVLYEMLSGRPAFQGEDVSDLLVAVLSKDVDLGALPHATSASIRRLLRRCLQKDPRQRLSAIADARLELDDASADQPAAILAANEPKPGWRGPRQWAVGGALLAVATVVAVTALRQTRPATPPVVRSEIAFPVTPLAMLSDRPFAINPSGTEIVVVGLAEGQVGGLFRRRLADDHTAPIIGSERAIGPFFSPDGEWLAFAQEGRLKKMPAGGGGAIDLGEVGDSQGGAFLPDGSVVFNVNHGEGLFRVDASGAERIPLTSVANEKGEAGHHWPFVLPGGTHVLFTTELAGKPYSEARIELLALASGERRVLIEGGSDARYVTSGHLLYWRGGQVWRVPFDLAGLRLTGAGVVALREVAAMQANGHALFSVADNGTLVYVTGGDPREERSLTMFDRTGAARPLPTERRAFESVSLSADGRRVVATIVAANDSIWTTELDRAALTRLTFDAENSKPIWAPDGKRIAFTRHRGGEPRRLFVMPADGRGTPELIRDSGGRHEATESWSSGGMIAFIRNEPTGWDIWVVNVDGERAARPFVATRFDEGAPRFSPDGKWIAYASVESGRYEVYVRPFPGPGPARLVSSDGGTAPRWRRDGREIFYRKADQVFAADVTGGTDPAFSAPHVLFKAPYHSPGPGDWGQWDVMPDGQRFIMIQDHARPQTALSMVQNWFAELKP